VLRATRWCVAAVRPFAQPLPSPALTKQLDHTFEANGSIKPRSAHAIRERRTAIAETTGIEQLDALINRLIEADQTGTEIHPFDVARELGEIRAQLMAMPTVHRGAEDLRHFRCEGCATISHGEATPQRCARCGGTNFVNVDIEAR
jgi:rubrerythrin